MSKYRCHHDKFSIRKLKKYGYQLYFEELLDPDGFPIMETGYCTEVCKEKMKEIFKTVLDAFSKNVQNYYEDVRIFGYWENDYFCHFQTYESFLKKKRISVDPIDSEDREALICFKVGILNGKPVRLCDLPEGTKCDYDADNLPKCDDEENEEDKEDEEDEDDKKIKRLKK